MAQQQTGPVVYAEQHLKVLVASAEQQESGPVEYAEQHLTVLVGSAEQPLQQLQVASAQAQRWS